MWACRGEPKAYPDCYPTLDRELLPLWKDDIEGRLFIEEVLQVRFAEHAQIYLNQPERELLEEPLAAMMLMRHFGVPTRLVDWSESLWVALYFASASNMDDDGRVRCFDKYQLTRNVMAKHPEADDWMKEHHPGRLNANMVGTSGLLADYLVARRPRVLTCQYLMWYKFPRLIAQQGFFTVATKPFEDHWLLAQEMLAIDTAGQGCMELTIAKAAKPEILDGLARMGITASSLYPGLDGIGMALQAFVRHSHLDIGVKEMLGRDWRSLQSGGPPRVHTLGESC